MFLLDSQMITEYMKEGLLTISDFEQSMLHPTYCYFRLGKWAKVFDGQRLGYRPVVIGEPGHEILSIPAHGYALIQTFERFTLSRRVLGFFGQPSALPRKGLRLNHSPTIDPLFDGYLEMGLENLLDRPAQVEYRERIGKVVFFDVSDTYPVGDIKGTLSEKDFKRREQLKGAEPLP